ncbi:MarR family transcriptional regulator [Aeromicrobium sp. YIM 150415]|uniref:MarR family winged helix-turn-helix transcriptional regulator n=1 Tax=Aeromicrobium sp. YIM 150415 TaxID=2803912 RepID=UPI0019628BEF|nr:MarR family transcriptional regulator [Aeromicrobium sp. YIM 150415]MBM9464730.1 MarR family transcriptional regulator [Aeromicrobium sp. YIM 150415]
MGGTAAGRPAHAGGRLDIRLLTLVAGRVNRDIGTVLAPDELSVDQWSVLDYLEATGPCTMTALANATGISGATLTRIVDRLVSRALVYRNADRGDRRRVHVHLSERGRETTQELRPRIRAAEDRTTAQLSTKERDELTRLLHRISTSSDPGA